MKTIAMTALLTLATATAFAQQPATPPAPTKDRAAANDSKEKAKQDPYAVQGSGAPVFSMLKGHEKGHVTLEDAEENSWLAGNFAKCDKDKDSKVTEAEYDACQPMRN